MVPLFDDRLLICEGPCNPEIHDCDVATKRYRNGLMTRNEEERVRLRKYDVLSMMGNRLVHTPHIAITNEHYRHGNFCQTFQCSVCGHKREY